VLPEQHSQAGMSLGFKAGFSIECMANRLALTLLGHWRCAAEPAHLAHSPFHGGNDPFYPIDANFEANCATFDASDATFRFLRRALRACRRVVMGDLVTDVGQCSPLSPRVLPLNCVRCRFVIASL